MNIPSYDVATVLAQKISGLAFASNLFVGREPDQPDNCVTIFDTPGAPPDVNYDKNFKVAYPSVQIRVRNTSYKDGWELINSIKSVLHNIGNEKINDTEYLLIACSQEPALLDWDEKNRARFVATFNMIRREE